MTNLNLHITNRCGLRCMHCLYKSGTDHLEETSLDRYQAIINEFVSFVPAEAKTMNLYGGEPLVRDDCIALIEHAHSRGVRVGITTSSIAPKDRFEQLLASPVSRITVDLHGAQDSHDTIRQRPGHYAASLLALEHAVDTGKVVNITCVVAKSNLSEIEAVLDAAQTLGVSAVSFYCLSSIGRGAGLRTDTVDGETWLDLRRRIVEWSRENEPRFSIIWERAYVSAQEPEKPSLCRSGTGKTLSIRCDGSVYFCCLLVSADAPLINMEGMSLGNINRQSLSSILENRSRMVHRGHRGCPALGLHEAAERGTRIDPRAYTATVRPNCPYDWEVLARSQADVLTSFAHIRRSEAA